MVVADALQSSQVHGISVEVRDQRFPSADMRQANRPMPGRIGRSRCHRRLGRLVPTQCKGRGQARAPQEEDAAETEAAEAEAEAEVED